MANIFIFHGTGGFPEENWFPWMKEKLGRLGHSVTVPQFPTPENQNINTWMNVFKGYEQYIDSNTIFIGHSLGCGFILNILENCSSKIKACFLVAGFLKKLNKPEFIELNKTFVDKEFDWHKIRENCQNFYVFNSNDDPHVPIEKGEELAQKLSTELILVQDAGHFNTSSGYTTFPLLLEKIQQIL